MLGVYPAREQESGTKENSRIMPARQRGTIILLNGTSSAGKSSIAAAIQRQAARPYLHTGIDHFMASLPRQVVVYGEAQPPASADGWALVFRDGQLAEVPRIGRQGLQILRGMYQAIAGYAAAGNDVIVDDVIYDRRVLDAAVAALKRQRVLFVGVECDLAVAVQRERERGDRAPGGAAIFHPLVHRYARYDLRIDSSQATPDELARAILAAAEAGGPWTALRQLATPG
jgi:chloramphenicol 3-O phosphotransferase